MALFALVFAVPAVSNIAIEVVELTLGVDCCGADDCDPASDASCPENCVHCTCCVHANALAPLMIAPPVGPNVRVVQVAIRADDVQASGFHATPFRPPAA